MTDFSYDKVAAQYDAFRRGQGPYLSAFVELARQVAARTVVEVGCGTGNVTRDFSAAHPCQMAALDLSRGMLGKACAKNAARAGDVAFLQGDARALPIESGAADLLFGVFVLQHINELASVIAEARRVVRTGGAVAFATASHRFITAHPMNAYFPSLAAVDTARFQDVPVLERAIRAADFSSTGAVVCRRAPEPIDAAYVEKVAGQFISTYALLPEGEFDAGLDRLRSDVHAQGVIGEHVWECVVVWGKD